VGQGKTLDEAASIKNSAIAGRRRCPVKSHCSILAEDAIKAAVNYNSATLRSDPLRVCFLPDLPTVSKAHVCHPHWCCHRYLAKRAKGVGVLGVNRSVQAWRKASIR
jgi:hypothetical protein